MVMIRMSGEMPKCCGVEMISIGDISDDCYEWIQPKSRTLYQCSKCKTVRVVEW